MMRAAAALFAEGLREIRALQPDWFVGIRQNGLVMGLEFAHPSGAQLVSRRLYDAGVWAIFSTLDTRVLQFKPGLLLDPPRCEDVLDRLAVAIAAARSDA
jgi:acetylornithine/succinyldiaminopimelate/putrescine aminotransferase